ncbi:MAG: hypothetical protein ACI8RP_001742, partial [Urechidicola sp.]
NCRLLRARITNPRYRVKTYSAWTYFKFLVKKISGKSHKESTIRVNYEEVYNRPSLKKI